ncbi:MAG: rane protein [Betaproteobacteria bacterium]|nr:rane protein [Betaproteobacteria bacterium]
MKLIPPRTALRLLKDTASSWSGDHAQAMGAALAYYSLFSVAPLLLIIIGVAGIFFGEDAVRGAIFDQLADLMGEAGAQGIAEMLAHANQPKTGGLAAALGVFLLIFGASGVFGQLRAALDRIWRAQASAKSSNLWGWLRANLLSMGMVFAMAFLIAVSLVLSTVVATLGKWWGAYLGGWTVVAQILDFAISFGMLTAIFALIYKVMPRAKVEWHDVWIGAATTAVLFTIGKFLIGLYLGKSSIGSSFGAFGSLAIFMVWVYYSAQIFLFGAEFTWVYAHELGSRRGERRPPPIEEMIAVPPVPERNPMLPVPVMQIEKSVPARQPRRTTWYEVGIAAAFVAGGALGVWNARRPPSLVKGQRGSIWRRWRLTDR